MKKALEMARLTPEEQRIEKKTDSEVHESAKARKCALWNCEKGVGPGNVYCAECREFIFSNWYEPNGDAPMDHECVVRRCGQPSRFRLCRKHGAPGVIHDVSAFKGVMSFWRADRFSGASVISKLDYELAYQFNGCSGFENFLREEGYKIRLISSPEELEAELRSGIPLD